VSTHLLLEAAARSLVMGAIILVALRLMRIEQVRARRTAWLLALAGALAMPLLVSAQIVPRLLPDLEISAPHAQAIAATAQEQPLPSGYGYYRGPLSESHSENMQVSPAPNTTLSVEDSRDGTPLANAALSLAVFGYCVVAAMLSLRLCAGVGFALRLRNQGERVVFPFDPDLDVRTSERVKSPVTIGSSVLLPRNFTAWDAATLRIVLSHERAHVRQKDFLIHTLAGLHCALFWFNPFSWWLQRQLAELGEALSDCAAVEEAESRAGYAEILLSFAARTRWPLAGVAMASASNLTPRIERLLNEQGFERSFAKARRLPVIAAGVVAVAMFASTSMVRVHASPTDVPPAPPTPTTPDSPATPNPPPAPATHPVPVTPPAPVTPASPAAVSPPASPPEPAETEDDDAAKYHKYDKYDTNEEGVLAIHSDHSNMMYDSGDQLPTRGGDYIYFQHNGKPYLIEDPQIIAKAQALLAPLHGLRDKEGLLRDQQSVLRMQQRMLNSQQRSIKLAESPEFKRQVAELQKTIKEIDLPRLTAQIDRQALTDIQDHLGEIQARIGELQSELGFKQGQFGEQMGRLGEQEGKLGEQQALMGEQQRKIIEDVRRQLKPIIEQALREGKGQVLEK
jgi:beta-lactamase regulating signal transducer with metallopeptidase domain